MFKEGSGKSHCPYFILEDNIMITEFKIADILKTLGTPVSLKGYKYIKYAIKLILQNENHADNIIRLYALVASKYDTTASRVERNIRHVIETAWDRGDVTTQRKLFGYTIDSNKGKPTNAEFMCTVADWLNMIEGESDA